MELAELIKVVRPYTMASEERLQWKAEVAQQIIREGIPGDFVECGVWNGGAAAIQAHYAIPAGRKYHLLDSWAGMPQPGSNDVPSVGGVTSESEIGKCVGELDKVREVMYNVGVLGWSHQIILHKGWFQDTFPGAKHIIGDIAMLNLDSDWYSSELLCWETFYDKVVPGGFIYIDDFFYWPGCQRAAMDFLEERGVYAFHPIGHSAWVQKGK